MADTGGSTCLTWGYWALIAASIAVSAAFPMLAPLLGIALLLGGFVTYRSNPMLRAVSLAALTIGAGLLLISLCITLVEAWIPPVEPVGP